MLVNSTQIHSLVLVRYAAKNQADVPTKMNKQKSQNTEKPFLKQNYQNIFIIGLDKLIK